VDKTETLRGLEDQIIRAKGELVINDGRIEELEYELELRESKIRELWTLRKEVERLTGELETIHQSLFYKLVKRVARLVDSLFPDGTRRGKFRLAVMADLRVVCTQGWKSMFKQALAN
jgi:hypothetical protein